MGDQNRSKAELIKELNQLQKQVSRLKDSEKKRRRTTRELKYYEAELQARARQQAAVAELGLRALAGTDPSNLMNQAVALVAQIFEVEYCKVLELLADGSALLLRAGVGWKEGYVGQATVGNGDRIASRLHPAFQRANNS